MEGIFSVHTYYLGVYLANLNQHQKFTLEHTKTRTEQGIPSASCPQLGF